MKAKHSLYYYLSSPTATRPTTAHQGDLGIDLYASESARLRTGLATLIPTGVHCIFPEGYGGLIRDRSSMATKNIIVGGGVIDNGYTGEIKILLTNLAAFPAEIEIEPGDKIAQMILLPVVDGAVVHLSEKEFGDMINARNSSRGADGFGSTGQ